MQGRIPDPLLGVPKPLPEITKKYLQKICPPFGSLSPRRRGGGERDKPLSISPGEGVNRVDIKAYRKQIQHQFDAFCKRVLRNASRDYFRKLARQAEREISLSEFPESGASIAAVMDDYFAEERQFEALGLDVAIKSELLAEALRLLPERQREIIMQYYFLGMSDRAIGEESDTMRSTICYQRNSALKKLKEILEGLSDDE